MQVPQAAPAYVLVDARGYSAGGGDIDEIVLLGESTTRSQSPFDPAIHTMEEVDVPWARREHSQGWRRIGGVGVILLTYIMPK